jgi:CBS domain-containing protein
MHRAAGHLAEVAGRSVWTPVSPEKAVGKGPVTNPTGGARMTTARELMTIDPVSIRDTDTLVVAARTMRDLDQFALPVCAEGHRLTGVLTDRDIVTGCVADGADPRVTTAAQVTVGVPLVVQADDCIEAALQLMAAKRVRRLPVVDEGRLVGDLHEAAVAVALPAVALAYARRPKA